MGSCRNLSKLREWATDKVQCRQGQGNACGEKITSIILTQCWVLNWLLQFKKETLEPLLIVLLKTSPQCAVATKKKQLSRFLFFLPESIRYH